MCLQQDSKENNLEAAEESETLLQSMLSQLTEEEMETAARTNYQYLQSAWSGTATVEDRQKHATAMARRYLKSKKDVDRALDCMRLTLQFRQEMKLDQLRRTFDDSIDDNDEQQQQFRSELAERLSSKKSFVMGYDKEGRATFHFRPPKSIHHDLHWTMMEALYTMERTIACSQRNAGQDSINAVVDIAGFQPMVHAPPLHVGQQFLQTLRRHYVGHIDKIVILDAPMAFVILWQLLSPFVGTKTSSKIVFLSGQENKTEQISQLYDPAQAAPWMMTGGRKERELDMDEYLYKTTFDHAFDEDK
ncbi:CRAL TRIO domain protein [Seminavis robusta]|uniref:CRAL TRIO domain protein n=1 Tax=Seminavis robusta TaxID=568900 RepID=A0A9N8HAG7_9STRA|nr:CRAL TRIO domain protein [Seminavis robusta]|eukprot:Sro147_g067970.1 CRAL TRIO domain protein (304) ;mRNA; r:81373-82284